MTVSTAFLCVFLRAPSQGALRVPLEELPKRDTPFPEPTFSVNRSSRRRKEGRKEVKGDAFFTHHSEPLPGLLINKCHPSLKVHG